MTEQTDKQKCASNCWAIGGGVGALGFVLMWFGGAGVFGALLWGAVLAVVVALVLNHLLCGAAQQDQATEGEAVPEPTQSAAPATAPMAPETAAIVHPEPEVRPEPEAQPAPAEAPELDAAPAADAPAPEAPTAETAPTRPSGLERARGGQADDLKRIKGIGPKLELLLHDLGIYHFDQIAAWGADEVAWVDDNLKGFKGRVSRDSWVAQAAELCALSEELG